MFCKWTYFKCTIWCHCLNESSSESSCKSNIFIKTVIGHQTYQLYTSEFSYVEFADGTLVLHFISSGTSHEILSEVWFL